MDLWGGDGLVRGGDGLVGRVDREMMGMRATRADNALYTCVKVPNNELNGYKRNRTIIKNYSYM